MQLERFTPYRLSVLANTISNAIARSYRREFRLSIPEWRVLAVLARFPGVSANAVGERTAMDKVAVSRAVQALERSGRVVRDVDTQDKRRSILSLSAEGRAIHARVAPRALDYERRLLSALSGAERIALDRLLTKLMHRASESA